MAGIDAFTVLCLHCDGTNGSTTFTDSALTPHTVTAVGNAQISTAQSVFGGASALFDGTTDALTVPDSADWDFGSGDFTIDFRVRFNALSADMDLIAQSDNPFAPTQFGWRLVWSQAGAALYFQYTTNGSSVNSILPSWSPSTATWYHVAVVRSGSNLYHFINGTQIGSTGTISGTIWNSTAPLTVGAVDSVNKFNSLNGWMDEVRVSKGIARWTSNFTPDAAAYSSSAVTSTKTGFARAGGVASGSRTGGTAAAAAYPYVDLVPSFDLDNVFNRWTVTRDQGSPQTAEDTTSQQKYFLRAKQTQTLVSDDAAALAQANRKIAKFKDPQNRIETMTIQPLTDLTNTAQIAAGLGRDIGHVITIKETPPGFAAAQTKNYVIQSISGQINAGPMTTMTLTFGVWPA